MNREAVGLVARRVNEAVERRENRRHIVAKAHEPDSVRQSGLSCAALPRGELGAGADDNQVRVPCRAAAQARPRVEQRIESLAAIAERTDEAGDRSIAGGADCRARSAALRIGDARESR